MTFTNAAMEFHDSDVAATQQEGTKVSITFSPAYVHRSEGIPGVDVGTGWTQEVVMVLFGCEFSGEFPRLPCTLCDGYVSGGSDLYNNVIPIPFIYVGDTRVNLSFGDGSEIQLTANELRLDTVGDPTYIEAFPGSNSS